ncbi:MAG TPA: CoA-transferase [Pyrinomonadaceae bacterium]|jgi:glutaconate CoA-transferase subunit A
MDDKSSEHTGKTIGITDPRNRNKVMTARQAVEKYIRPGTCLCIGGFGYTRLPMTLIRELIRQRTGELFVTTCGAAAAMEVLAANRLIKRVDTTYIGLEGLQPVAASLRRQIEDGEIELIEDYDNYSFSTRALAARYGWPFAPVMCGLGSDLLEYDNFGDAGLRGRKEDGSWIHPSIPPKPYAVIEDPFDGWGLRPHQFEGGDTTANETNALDQIRRSKAYTGREGVRVALVPPLLPEVTIIRAQTVGEEGTVRLEGLWAADNEQAIAAKNLIVECEKIVPEEELRALPEANTIGAHYVDAIVEQPFGGYPSAVPGYYDYDWDFWVNYSRINRSGPEELERWWREHVAETEDDWDFFANKVGRGLSGESGPTGWERLFELRADPQYGYNPALKRSL